MDFLTLLLRRGFKTFPRKGECKTYKTNKERNFKENQLLEYLF